MRMGGWSNGMTPGLQPGDRNSTPRPVQSTFLYCDNGLLVQRDDTGIAGRKSGFDSPAVHCTHSLDRPRSDEATGPSPNGRVPPWRGGGPGSTPGGSTAGHRYGSWKVAGYRLAGPLCSCGFPAGNEDSTPLPSARLSCPACPDGEEDDHASVLTRSPGFESSSGHPVPH